MFNTIPGHLGAVVARKRNRENWERENWERGKTVREENVLRVCNKQRARK